MKYFTQMKTAEKYKSIRNMTVSVVYEKIKETVVNRSNHQKNKNNSRCGSGFIHCIYFIVSASFTNSWTTCIFVIARQILLVSLVQNLCNDLATRNKGKSLTTDSRSSHFSKQKNAVIQRVRFFALLKRCSHISASACERKLKTEE